MEIKRYNKYKGYKISEQKTYWVIKHEADNEVFYVGVESRMNCTGYISPGHWYDINKAFAFDTYDGADTFIRGYIYGNNCKPVKITRITKQG